MAVVTDYTEQKEWVREHPVQGTFSEEEPLRDIRQFLSIIAKEPEKLEHLKLDPTRFKTLQVIEDLGLHSLYREIMYITKKILQVQDTQLKDRWQALLLQLDGHPGIYGKSEHPFTLKTSVAQSVLDGTFKDLEPSVRVVDLKNREQREKFIDSLERLDTFTFDEGHNRKFLDDMLKGAVAIGAYDKNGNVVGGMWGFRVQYPDTSGRDRSVFHVWWLAISPELSSANLGKDIMNFGERQIPDLDIEFVSLNVNGYNKHIKQLVRSRGFRELPGQDPKSEKIFMILPVGEAENSSVTFEPNMGNTLVTNYVLAQGSISNLVYNEISRSKFGRWASSMFS